MVNRTGTFFFCLGLLMGVPCAAETLPDLSHTMRYHDVVKAWGAPKEKRAFEAKREEMWIYDEAKVIFNEGKVVAWMASDDTAGRFEFLPPRDPAPAETARPSKGSSEPIEGEDAMVEDILREILNEPASTGGGAVGR